jgi:site-specific DNA recombinase
MTIPRKQAAIYARVSSKEQEKEGFSIPAQLRLLRDYADQQGLTVVREFVDIETAKRSGRPNFEAMLTFFRRNRSARVLLVEKTDRLYRNLKDWVSIDALDIDIHLVKENVELSPDSRSADKFMHGIKVLMAKNYIDNLAEETQKGMREKAEQGIYPSWAPIGYRNFTGPNGKRQIEPDPESAPLVARVFETYAQGHHSVKQAAKVAREIGLNFRSGAPMTTGVLHKILRNPIYMGRFRWAQVEYAGIHEPIVPAELWNRVQETLDGRCSIGPHPSKHDFAFAGLVTCGHCGCSMVGEIKKGRYVYYHCTGSKQKCDEPYTREEILADRFGELLKGLAMDRAIVEVVSEALRVSHDAEKRDREEAVARLQEQHQRLQDRIDTMYVDKLEGRIDNAFFDRKATEWRRQQRAIMDNIQAQSDTDQNYIEAGIQLLEMAADAHELYLEQDMRARGRFLQPYIEASNWKQGLLEVTWREPFATIEAGIAAAKAADAASNPGSIGRDSQPSNSAKSPKLNSESGVGGAEKLDFANWLRSTDSNREPCG